MKVVLFKLFAFASLVVLLGSQQVAAFNSNDFYCAQTTTCFYEPGCANPMPATDTSSGTPGPVYIMGDSITHLAQDTYTAKFTGDWSATVKGLDSRHIVSAPPSPGGLDQVTQDAAIIGKAHAIVIALGTNDYGSSGASTKNSVQSVVAKLKNIESKAGSSAPIYWVNIYVDGHDSEAQTTNQAIRDGVGNDGTVIDWYTEAKNKADVASFGEGVHPTKQKDIDLLVNLVYGAVTGSSGSPASQPASCCGGAGASTLSGDTNGARAFNYFVGKGLTPEVAAGIVGNLTAESVGVEPERLQGDFTGRHSSGSLSPSQLTDGSVGWGIAQFTSPDKIITVSHDRGIAYTTIDTLSFQLDFLWEQFHGSEQAAFDAFKNASSPEEAAQLFEARYERPQTTSDAPTREAYARAWFNFASKGTPLPHNVPVSSSDAGGGATSDATGGVPTTGCGDTATAGGDITKTITVNTPGKFITLPSKYSCPGHTTVIDSRLAADIAYLVNTYNLCANDGLANGHLSHGAGVAVDMVPRSGNSKDDWKNSAEAAARDMGWYGDGADDPKGSHPSCANYGAGDYGQCMHEVYPDKFPQWLRWLGYNGAYDHGDPWHIYGGAGAHIHIGWDTPNHDGVAPSIISSPRKSVYAFPAPIPDDLKALVN